MPNAECLNASRIRSLGRRPRAARALATGIQLKIDLTAPSARLTPRAFANQAVDVRSKGRFVAAGDSLETQCQGNQEV